MTAALERGEWSAACSSHILPLGKTRYPLWKRMSPNTSTNYISTGITEHILSIFMKGFMFIFYYTFLKNTITAHYFCTFILILFSVLLQPNASHCFLVLEVSRSHTMTHHSWWDSSGWVISSSQRPLPVNTQHSEPRGVRTHNLSNCAVTDLHHRMCGHWNRFYSPITCAK